MIINYVAALVLTVSFGLPPELLTPQQDTNKANEVLVKSREAIGCGKLKSLQMSGNYRQVIGEREMAGEIELEGLMPEKFLKTTTASLMPGVELTRIEALNGDQTWMDSRNSSPSGGMVMLRMGPGGNNSPEAIKQQQTFVRQEWSRVLLGLLASTPSSLRLEFSYSGEAEAPEGVADVLDVKGPDNFAAQLFIDQKTHLPLMVSYKGRKPRVVTRTVTAGEARKSPADMDHDIKEAQEKVAAEPLVEIQIRFIDFKTEGGVMLPHRVTRSMDGQINEEWELTKFRINQTVKPDKFEKK